MVARTLTSSRNGLPIGTSICQSCRRSLQRRHASSAAAAAAEPTPATLEQRHPPFMTATVPRQRYDIRASVVLSRPPVITRDLTPFEREYFFYQRRLSERMTLPFTRYFYYQKNTPADLRWKQKMKERQIPGRDLGGYNPYSRDAWNDEILVGDDASSPQKQVDALIKDANFGKDKKGEGDGKEGEKDAPKAEKIKVEEQLVELPYPRVTEADQQRDLQSLNRALSRTLYLLVREEKVPWRFPNGLLEENEDLFRAAERLLVQTGGINMNTWVLGHAPVGHYVRTFDNPKSEEKVERLGEKTFFMTARIMAGQPKLASNQLGLSDFRWLAKDEIQKEVSPGYWKAVKNMLVEL